MLGSRRLAGAAALACLAWAAFDATAGVIQVTNIPAFGFVNRPSISADGHLIAFDSDANIAGLNPMFLDNVFVYEMISGSFTLVSKNDGWNPWISGNGRFVAFTSDADYTRHNADGSEEIFRYDLMLKRMRQLTSDRTDDGCSDLASIDGDGKETAFESTSSLGHQNEDESPEVYIHRGTNRAMSKDPCGDGESHNVSISRDGSLVAFMTTSSLTGGNLDGSQEIMLYDVHGHRLSQITNDPQDNGDSSVPSVSGDGTYTAFASGSNLGGLNPDFANAIYVHRREGLNSIVTVSAGEAFDADLPAINDSGEWIALVSGYNITGGNSDGSDEILLYNRIRKTFLQLTDSPRSCFNTTPDLTADGSHIVYVSNCDPTGGNPDHSTEVFVADNPGLALLIHAEGNVGLVVTDPQSGGIDQFISSIPFATYQQGDFNGNGVPEVLVTIPQALEGTYLIHIVAATGSNPSDPVTIDGTLNGLNVQLASGTVGELTNTDLSFSNQGLVHRSATMKPLAGDGSVVSLTATVPHLPATSGPVAIVFTDGLDVLHLDFGDIADFYRGTFNAPLDGFSTKLRVAGTANGMTSVRLKARNGDLSAFSGMDDVNMTIALQIGADTDMYNWRFKRNPVNGTLTLH